MVPFPRHWRRLPMTLWLSSCALIAALALTACGGSSSEGLPAGGAGSAAPSAGAAVELTPTQLAEITVTRLGTYPFAVEIQAVGSIDYDGDRSVQVFPPYPGRIVHAFADLGETVADGQPLYAITSPDLIQAESTLISAAASRELTARELERVRTLAATNSVPVRELEQAASDQQTADGTYQAARAAVRLLGKTGAEIDTIVARRRIDPALVVRSPMAGQITAKVAPPGLFVQPGNAPAPFAVADVAHKWMLASVLERDSPRVRIGEPVDVVVMAYPNRTFSAKVSRIDPVIDPNVHRITIRCEVADLKNELRAGMLANFTIQVAKPAEAVAIPANGVVREGDGTMTAWVTNDRQHFRQRTIRTGLREHGLVQVLAGLQSGELAVTDGAIFLDNMLQEPADD